MVRLLIIAAFAALTLSACDGCPEVAMIDGPEGLVIIEEEHPDGWGLEECTTCHAMGALHRRGCSPGVDLQMVRDQVDEEGLDVCWTCHGDNGVFEDEVAEEETE